MILNKRLYTFSLDDVHECQTFKGYKGTNAHVHDRFSFFVSDVLTFTTKCKLVIFLFFFFYTQRLSEYVVPITVKVFSEEFVLIIAWTV